MESEFLIDINWAGKMSSHIYVHIVLNAEKITLKPIYDSVPGFANIF